MAVENSVMPVFLNHWQERNTSQEYYHLFFMRKSSTTEFLAAISPLHVSVYDRFSRWSVLIDGENRTMYGSSGQTAAKNSVSMVNFLDINERNTNQKHSQSFHDKIDHDHIFGSYLINGPIRGCFP
jgi:hypothetical protein